MARRNVDFDQADRSGTAELNFPDFRGENLAYEETTVVIIGDADVLAVFKWRKATDVAGEAGTISIMAPECIRRQFRCVE